MSTKNADPNNPVVHEILRQGQRLPPDVRRRYIAAALETGRVETNFKNVPGGDADSVNWRQERASIYGGDMSIRRSVARFYKEARQQDRGQTSYGLAADVQRPAAQYRGRYKGAQSEALGILAGANPSNGSGVVNDTAGTVTKTTTPGVDNSGMRRQLVADFLSQGGVKNSQATASFATGYKAAQDVPGRTTTTRTKGRLDPETASVHGVQAVQDRADKLSADKRPYLWGGGHGGDSWGLDCSGAVSQALGVDVRVASEFEKFGKPGPGKNVTILASDKHVLMRVRDPQTGSWHYWGTSRSNPDGGPGWIPASALPASYLKNFTARHPDGQ